MALSTAAKKIKSQSVKITSNEPKFFSVAGQKKAIARAVSTVATVVNPFSKEKIYLNQGGTYSPVGVLNLPVTRTAFLGGVLAVPVGYLGKTLTAGKAVAATTGTAIAGTSSTLWNKLTNPILWGVGGYGLAQLTGKSTVSPTQQTGQTTTTTTDASQHNISYVYAPSYQETKNLIRDSAGASISSAQTARPQVEFTPSQEVSPAVAPYQYAGQTAQEGTNWLLVAGIVAGALILTKK